MVAPDAHDRGDDLAGARLDVSVLVAELRETRRALLETIETLPETRIHRATERDGWTLKHELCSLVAADAELRHVLDGTHLGTAPAAEAIATDAFALRRVRGQAMHAVQELRLGPLRQHLEVSVERSAEAILTHAALLDEPIEIPGREIRCMADYLQAHAAQAREGLERIRRALG